MPSSSGTAVIVLSIRHRHRHHQHPQHRHHCSHQHRHFQHHRYCHHHRPVQLLRLPVQLLDWSELLGSASPTFEQTGFETLPLRLAGARLSGARTKTPRRPSLTSAASASSSSPCYYLLLPITTNTSYYRLRPPATYVLPINQCLLCYLLLTELVLRTSDYLLRTTHYLLFACRTHTHPCACVYVHVRVCICACICMHILLNPSGIGQPLRRGRCALVTHRGTPPAWNLGALRPRASAVGGA